MIGFLHFIPLFIHLFTQQICLCKMRCWKLGLKHNLGNLPFISLSCHTGDQSPAPILQHPASMCMSVTAAWVCNSVSLGLCIPAPDATPAFLLALSHWWPSWLGPTHTGYLHAFPASDFLLLPAAEPISVVPLSTFFSESPSERRGWVLPVPLAMSCFGLHAPWTMMVFQWCPRCKCRGRYRDKI